MKKKIIFVFHNGHKGGELTRDCRLRIEAVKQIVVANQDAIICFVGGGGISGAKYMQNFWQENYPKLPNKLCLLEKANNTADSIKEITEYIKNNTEGKEVILISSVYHIKRIAFFAKRYKLNASIIAAEDILLENKELSSEVERYKNSFAYFLKLRMEQIMMVYIMIDPNQKIVRLWRKYLRNWK